MLLPFLFFGMLFLHTLIHFIHYIHFQKLVPVSLSNVMCTVKILALDRAPDLDVVIDFLKCFPCVEKLYVVVRVFSLLNSVSKHPFCSIVPWHRPFFFNLWLCHVSFNSLFFLVRRSFRGTSRMHCDMFHLSALIYILGWWNLLTIRVIC